MNTHWLIRIYNYLLKFFPDRYLVEYGEEQAYVFRMAATDVYAQGGTSQLLMFAWRELRDLPWAVVQAHLYERRPRMKYLPGAYLPGEPIVRWKLAAALLPFVLFAFYTLLIDRSGARLTAEVWNLLGVLSLVMFLGIVFLAVLGVVRGLPTWSLPAWSIPFFIVNLLSIEPAYSLLALPVTLQERIVVMALRALVSYGTMLALGLALLFLVRPFYRRVRQDWTLLAFLMYCGFPLFANFFDPYVGLDIFESGAFVLMGLGALAFLLAPKKWQRFTVLSAALILAFALVSWGIYTVFPEQSFARGGDFRTWEAIQPLLMVPGMIFALALTPLISRIPGVFLRQQQPAGSQP